MSSRSSSQLTRFAKAIIEFPLGKLELPNLSVVAARGPLDLLCSALGQSAQRGYRQDEAAEVQRGKTFGLLITISNINDDDCQSGKVVTL